jgi:hypothetical protein
VVFTAIAMKVTAFCDVMMYNLIHHYNILQIHAVPIFHVGSHSSALKMKVAGSYKILVVICQTVHHDIPDDICFQDHSHENHR